MASVARMYFAHCELGGILAFDHAQWLAMFFSGLVSWPEKIACGAYLAVAPFALLCQPGNLLIERSTNLTCLEPRWQSLLYTV